MNIYVVCRIDAETGLHEFRGVYNDLDSAKRSVDGHWELFGTHDLTPIGWYNGDYVIDPYVF